jgi:hypothetical protein
MKMLRWISILGPRVRAAIASFLVLLLVVFVYPFKTTVVPEWNLTVVDDGGTSVGEINVTEHWQHYLLESAAHEESRRTSQDGFVSFPARAIRASLLGRGWATISRIKQDGRRARRMPVASIVVWGSKYYATTVAVYTPNEPPQSHIVVQSLR